MPRRNLKLTEAEIRNAKPRPKEYKLYDDEGLRLMIRPSGSKVWQYPYKCTGSRMYTPSANILTLEPPRPDSFVTMRAK